MFCAEHFFAPAEFSVSISWNNVMIYTPTLATEIVGNIRQCMNDFPYGQPICESIMVTVLCE